VRCNAAPASLLSDVQKVRITSKFASALWNHPTPLGAVVLLPKGYAEHPTQRYPVVYTVGRFRERAPFGFTFDGCEKSESAEARSARLVSSAREPGCEFQAAWTSGTVPECIGVFIHHTTPFYRSRGHPIKGSPIKGSESLSDQGVRVLE
jgi:hypothetical protein